jgi:hypothetical protein
VNACWSSASANRSPHLFPVGLDDDGVGARLAGVSRREERGDYLAPTVTLAARRDPAGQVPAGAGGAQSSGPVSDSHRMPLCPTESRGAVRTSLYGTAIGRSAR